jgi:membrane protein
MGLERVVEYLRRELWEAEPQELVRGVRDRVRRFVRLAYLAIRGFIHDGGVHRASALSFDTVLATVPLLAIVFSVLKSLGAYEMFVAETARPWIDQTFGPTPTVEEGVVQGSTLREAFLGLLELVDQSNVGRLGLIGLVVLLYIVLMLLSTVEQALNEIFGVERSRVLVRRVADYAAILFAAPFCLAMATASGAWFATLGLGGGAMRIVTEVGVFLVAVAAFTFLYVVMPHRRVRVGSAVVGAVVGALFWYGALVLHARFQVGVARYNAIYSGFAALPLFLLWVFVSWIGVLLGAEVGAAHEDEAEFRWRIKDVHPGEDLREVAGVRMLIEVARAFARADKPPSRKELARAAKAPVGFAKQVLDDLVRAGFLTEAVRNGDQAYALTKDPAEIRISGILEALHRGHGSKFPGIHGDRRVAERLEELYKAMAQAPANATLRELAQEWERRRDETTRTVVAQA